MAVGISAAFSGLMGMMGSSALGFMIPALGWRSSYGIIGAASIVLILPVSLFVLRNRPSDKGMLPYGAESFRKQRLLPEKGRMSERMVRQPQRLVRKRDFPWHPWQSSRSFIWRFWPMREPWPALI